MRELSKLHWFLKTLLLLLILSIFTLQVLFSPLFLPSRVIEGEIKGVIFQNQIWSGNINISGDLITMPLVWITIEPGTKIYINKNGDKNNFDVLPWHLKHGINTGPPERGILSGEPFWDESEKIFVYISNLKSNGEINNPILITSASMGSPYDVNLIKIGNGEISNTIFSNYRRLEVGQNIKIRESKFENTGECAICINSGSPLLEANTFINNKRDYINIKSASPLIKGNTFLESEGDGIFVESGDSSRVRIFENKFQMPSRKAIKVGSDIARVNISENNFITGDIDLPCKNLSRLVNNKISGKVIFRNIGDCKGEYTILENYWEILDPESILNARISGTSEKFKVIIPRIFKNPPRNAVW